MRTPNEEQKKAIEHQGNVLLSAGAGSGKTFVLVEHVIYFVQKYLDETECTNEDIFLKELKEFLSAKVIMTFTKKAAGEISLRLRERVSLQVKTSTSPKWKYVQECLNSLTVSTIHGFCYKLLEQGYFTVCSSEIEIITEIKFKSTIENLFNTWMVKYLNQNDCDKDISELLLVNHAQVLNALHKIFGSPELRLQWQQDETNQTLDDIVSFFTSCFQVINIESIFTDRLSLDEYVKDKSKGWYKTIQNFNNLSIDIVNSSEDYQKIENFFLEHKRIVAPRDKETYTTVINFLDKLKVLRKFCKDNSESIHAYFEHMSGACSKWSQVLRGMYQEIEQRYFEIRGMTFSDLEYYVSVGLQNSASKTRVYNSYDYFIIDEFQDTSYVQFEIIRKIINNDFQRLFCIGDPKQAIYGFRGGEIGVFNECADLLSNNLSLKNNYRSDFKVIEFNNLLFEKLFKKGEKFQGEDSNKIIAERQLYPLDGDHFGRINRILVNVEDESFSDEKVSSREINYFEAKTIINTVIKIKQDNKEESICILYSKLAPTKILLPLLMEQNVSFSSQMKVPVEDDPVMGIFKILVESFMDFRLCPKENIQIYTEILMKCYLSYLKIRFGSDLNTNILQFFHDLTIMGVLAAFQKFIFKVGLSNSNYVNNMILLENIIQISNGNIDLIWEKFNNESEGKYSIDFQFGKEKNKVIIMTSHASKGLEFDHVILGGIHTNGSSVPNTQILGSLPNSFKWKINSRQKKMYKSPNYILESYINSKKEFSESKRLFYVACTRAKKSLVWADINIEGKPSSKYGNSWINGFRSCDLDIEIKTDYITEDRNDFKVSYNDKSADLPLFHSDPVGVNYRDGSSTLGVTSELSVTKLASISECPHKFYLQNICKFTDDDLLTIQELTGSNPIRQTHSSGDVVSNSDRGTKLHAVISEMINRNWVIPYYINDDNDIRSLEWIKSVLMPKITDFKFISEEAIKFS
ncbi:MAG: UvrD-helicase domain-containing protein, partial [Bdellovibrionales bacterium]|nr:UvrD-helicase domain-containing protein [Bdellovibrionales bacterium]